MVTKRRAPDLEGSPWHRKAQAERGTRGWSYAELARRIGESPEMTRRWLSGKVQAREDVVRKIAGALGWPIDLFLDPAVPFSFAQTRAQRDAWIRSVLGQLSPAGREVVAALIDERTATYLQAALTVYRQTFERLREDARRG